MGIYTIEHGYRRRSNGRLAVVIVIIVAITALGGYLLYQPHPPKPAADSSKITPASVQPETKLNSPIPWPNYGQSAYGVLDKGVLAVSNDAAKPVPIASLAKIITALAILKQKPLAPGEQGPMLTLDQVDIDSFSDYIRKDGSVVPVEVGEQISQYQAMQAMLMPSANNMSDSLARWAFGSVDNYVVSANSMIKELGLSGTVVADASGFSSKTVSTAHDLVRLGTLYMQQPVLIDIASQSEARIPVAGLIQNYNSVINKDGILGIKVGNTDEAGRCFLVADIRKNQGNKDTVSVVAVVGAPHLDIATADAQAIFSAANTGYDQLIKH